MARLELRSNKAMTVLLIVLAIVFVPIAIMPLPIGARIVFGLCSVPCLVLAVILAKRRLSLDERGVTAQGAFGARHVDWDEVDHYTFWSMNQNAAYVAGAQGGAFGALVAIAVVAGVRAVRSSGKHRNRRFNQGQLTLVTRSGAKLVIDARYSDVIAALDYAFTELHARLRGKPQDFSPFSIGDTELRHAKKGVIGLPDIQHVGCGGARITIKKRDKRLAWAGAHMKSIKNVMLFLETIAEKGLVIDANAEVFLPPTVLDKLRAAASRQAAMPRARVVDRR